MKMKNNENFKNFIDKLEIVYAILIAWGFARIAKNFWSKPLDHWLCLIICALVLIRFFFAPSYNLKTVAKPTKDRPLWQRFVFLCDVPILIGHSLIYYGMCACKPKETVSSFNIPKFYLLFFLLLLLNVIWLWSISRRMYHFNKKLSPDDEKSPIKCFVIWRRNNFFCIVIFAVLLILHIHRIIDLSGKHLPFLFIVALFNCIIDFLFTAPDYLGFREQQKIKNIENNK